MGEWRIINTFTMSDGLTELAEIREYGAGPGPRFVCTARTEDAEQIVADHNARDAALRRAEASEAEAARLREALEQIAESGCRTAFSLEWGQGIETCLDLLRVIREQGSNFGAPRILTVAFTMKDACKPCCARAALTPVADTAAGTGGRDGG